MADNAKRYLAIIQLKNDSSLARIAADAPKIIEFLTGFSKGEHELAFRSNDRLIFAYFLKTAAPQFLQAEFDKCPGTQNGDAMMVVEVGALVGGTAGFSRAWTWLQRH